MTLKPAAAAPMDGMVLRRIHHSQAGGTAEAHYAHLLRLWRRQVRLPLLVAGGATTVLAVLLWQLAPHGEFYAGLAVGSICGIAQWVWSDPPDYVARWKRGTDGERETASRLKELEQHGWHAFHDRGQRKGNLDHVLVGPSGVFLLESKNRTGAVSVDAGGLTSRFPGSARNDYTHVNLAGYVLGSAARLKDRIESETAIRMWVQAVVVIWGDFESELLEQQNVVYLSGDRLVPWLLEQPKKLSPRNQRFIELAVEAELVAPVAKPIPTT